MFWFAAGAVSRVFVGTRFFVVGAPRSSWYFLLLFTLFSTPPTVGRTARCSLSLLMQPKKKKRPTRVSCEFQICGSFVLVWCRFVVAVSRLFFLLCRPCVLSLARRRGSVWKPKLTQLSQACSAHCFRAPFGVFSSANAATGTALCAVSKGKVCSRRFPCVRALSSCACVCVYARVRAGCAFLRSYFCFFFRVIIFVRLFFFFCFGLLFSDRVCLLLLYEGNARSDSVGAVKFKQYPLGMGGGETRIAIQCVTWKLVQTTDRNRRRRATNFSAAHNLPLFRRPIPRSIEFSF